MTKLVTPPGILLTVAVLMIYSAYAFLIGFVEDSWILMAVGVLSVIASIATALLKPWSQYLVYALAAGFVGKLTWSIIAALRVGFFGFQFGSPGEVLRSMMPNLIMAFLSCACCWIVYQHFATDRARLAPITGHSKPDETG